MVSMIDDLEREVVQNVDLMMSLFVNKRTLCLGAIIIADGADALLLAEVEVVKVVELMSGEDSQAWISNDESSTCSTIASHDCAYPLQIPVPLDWFFDVLNLAQCAGARIFLGAEVFVINL
jgi:hypothetical protein